MKSSLLILFFFYFQVNSALSQAGIVDSTFGINGVASFFSNGAAYSVAVQSDGKIITGGGFTQNFGLVRFNMDGTLDSSFGTNGKVEIMVGIGGANGEKIVLQPDGKIIEGGACKDNSGYYAFALVRFNVDGTLDYSFGSNGIVLTSLSDIENSSYGRALALQPDGKIIQVGYSSNNFTELDFAVARFNTDGSIDNSFGTNGKVLTHIGNTFNYATCVEIQQDGKILVGGYAVSPTFESSFAIIRYNSDGSLDNSFGVGGGDTTYFSSLYHYDDVFDMALQSDEKILMGGFSIISSGAHNSISMVRYNSDGSLDSGFGNGGKVVTSNDSFGISLSSIIIQPDEKILVAGGGNFGFLLARYYSDGHLDSLFGDNGIVTIQPNNLMSAAYSHTLQADGKIIVSGWPHFTVMRFLSGLNIGMLNLSVDELPILIYPNPIQSQATLQYMLTNEECITISLYNMQGSNVQTFITNETRNQGEHKEALHLDEALPSGEYILSISNGVHSQGIKISKLK